MKDTFSTIVKMPDNSHVEVNYYCSDVKLAPSERKNQTQLFIQLDDCICTIQIEKSTCENIHTLERIVHSKVINTKGHLC